MSTDDTTTPTGVEGVRPAAAATSAPPRTSAREPVVSRELPGWHWRLTEVRFRDRTDAVNELVFENEWLLHPRERDLSFRGNCFGVENAETGDGFVVLLLEPLPERRPEHGDEPDVLVEKADTGYTLRVFCDRPDHVVTLDYAGGELGRTRALQAYQREIRPATTWHRRASFLSNTWGDRNRDARIGEEFILREIDAAERLGVDVVQIDDGWEAGTTANAVAAQDGGSGRWSGYWDEEAPFWAVNAERFPNGLEPVVAAARERGMEIGLWYSPDSSRDFENWERDVDQLVELHERLGVRFFKMDGIDCPTRTAFDRLERLLTTVIERTGGEVVFDLDITAQTRPGCWGLAHTGPLFVENRYTDWHGYWPHHTLRNLWKLARWVDPLRLRFELLNNARNTTLYRDDPLAPHTYRPEVLFAMVMAGNPLGWFEVSSLPDAWFDTLPRLVGSWKERRERWARSVILPVGEEPDGWGISGFLVVDDDDRLAEALFFRGAGRTEAATIRLPVGVVAPGAGANGLEPVAGTGSVRAAGDQLEVQVPERRSFVWFG